MIVGWLVRDSALTECMRSALTQLQECEIGDRTKGCLFETHRRLSHCVVSLNKTLYPLLSTGSTQETGIHPDMTINVDWDVKHQNKQTQDLGQFPLPSSQYLTECG